MKRRADPEFDVEPWASTLVDYCYFGGASPPPSMNTEPLEASRAYVVLDELPALDGDFDEDGDVDGNDLVRWKTNFGASGSVTHLQGDADGDQDVDGADFLTWQRQLGMPTSSTAAETAPEPAAGVMLLSGFLAVLGRRRCIIISHVN